MKKIFKILGSILLVCLLLIGGYTAYFYFLTTAKTKSTFNVIPSDSLFMLETKNITDAVTALRESKLWSYLVESQYFGDINESIEKIDDLLDKRDALDFILKDRKLVVSAHVTSSTSLDFLVVIDMQKAAELPGLKEAFSLSGFKVKREEITRKVNGETVVQEIIEMKDTKKGTTFYLAIIDNLLVASLNQDLVLFSIIQNDDVSNWNTNDKFQDSKFRISSNKLFNFYFNYAELERMLNTMVSASSDLDYSFSKILAFAAFNIHFEDDILSLNGYTNMHDIKSHVNALARVEPGKMRSPEVLSNQTAFSLSICFDSFDDFFNSMQQEFSADKSKEYAKQIKKLEDILKTDLKQDFFSWIGNEIFFAKLRPSSKETRAKDVVMGIHASDIDDAKTGLTHLTEQIKKTTPLRFDIVTYKNYRINYLNLHGFLKLLFGSLFRKLEKPYFTYIGDYVVFSNSEAMLKKMIDDYISKNTLARKKTFMDFKDKFDDEANINIFIQMPKIYTNLYTLSKPKQRLSLKKNKALILSFARIGFQMLGEDDTVYKTTLLAEHDSKAALEDKLEIASADDLFNDDYEALVFKIELPKEDLEKEGPHTVFYSENKPKYEGIITGGKLTGEWKSFYKNGNIRNIVTYKKGKVNGKAVFYYNKAGKQKKADMTFENSKITGTYREYFKNGARKAAVPYEDGQMNGFAKLFYPSTQAKSKGSFEDGKKDGDWRYYSEFGKLQNTIEWDEGEKVD
ncbi:MAG: DUF3352 domain-containing protein [bacterium]|nr:DUF3352 domain-containing protein [bacterium]